MLVWIVYLGIYFLEINIKYIEFVVPISFVICLHLFYDFYKKTFFVTQKSHIPLLTDIILYGGQIVVYSTLFWLGKMTLINVFYALLSLHIISCGVIYLFFRKFQVPIIKPQKTFIKHYNFSKWLLGTAVLQWFSGNYYIIVAAAIIGPIAIGAVRIAQTIVGLCHILFLVMEVMLPIEAAKKYAGQNTQELTQYIKKIGLQWGILIALILMSISITAPSLIKYIYGTNFVSYSYIITAYCVVYFFVFINLLFNVFLRTVELTKPVFFAYIGSTMFSLLTANFFIQSWEINGLLIGLLLTQIINIFVYQFFVANFFRYENYSLSPRKS